MGTTPASAISPRRRSAGGDLRMGHRRTYPAESSSLPLHKKQKLAHDLDRGVDDDLDGAKLGLLPQQESTGPGSTVSGSKWFDSVNQHVKSGKRTSPQTSDEPPFFLNSQSAFNPNNFVSSGSEEVYGNDQRDRDASENEDLRGVIDDLTIENKQLRRLLKGFLTRPGSVPDAQDKIFELRVHGLPSDKKRELERLLRSFATSAKLHPKSIPSSSATYGSGHLQSSEGSSRTNQQDQSKRPQTDSGYASNSTSALNSATVSNVLKSQLAMSERSRNKNIKNYLHDIPDSLLPRQPPFMSDTAKMALVVQRLEQLFTGNKAAPGDHMQPTQQQEVSHSAARADASGNNQPRNLEGSREAHILPHDTKLNIDTLNQDASTNDRIVKLRRGVPSAASSDVVEHFSRPNSPEQRPTRPLDLDIHRAQVAADNMDYLRHLGLTMPQASAPGGDNKRSSWIYLNLLISMAQLHTINVTPTFIRRAIRKMSTKLELSPDGHKVQWRGGLVGTLFSQQQHEEEEQRVLDPPTENVPDKGEKVRHRGSKRSKATSSSNNISEEPSSEVQTSSGAMQHHSMGATSTIPTSQTQTKRGSAFDYQPLFYKGIKDPTQGTYLDSTSPSGSGGSSSAVQALSRWSLSQPRNDEGMIIFFNTPHFCSDASGDSSPIHEKPTRSVLPENTLGLEKGPVEESVLRSQDACYFTPEFAAPAYVPQPKEGPENSADDDDQQSTIAFEPTPFTSSGTDEQEPMDMPVSGLGGVLPEDNFAVDVKVGRLRRPEFSSTERIPVTGSRKRKCYSYHTLRCEVLSLKASKLPPPSYVFFTNSSSSDSRQSFLDSVSDSTDSPEDENFPAPAAFLNHWDSGGTSDDDMDRDTSSGFDMLAISRGADPTSLARQETAFAMTNRDENIKIGASVAATVGASRSSSSSNADVGRKYDSDDDNDGGCSNSSSGGGDDDDDHDDDSNNNNNDDDNNHNGHENKQRRKNVVEEAEDGNLSDDEDESGS